MANEAETKLLEAEGQNDAIISIQPTLLTKTCAKCAYICPSEAKFCSECGATFDNNNSESIDPAAAPQNKSIIVNSNHIVTINEGVTSQILPIAIIQSQNSEEGQVAAICGIANCDSASTRQCSVCQTNVCTTHCQILSLPNQRMTTYQCSDCVANAMNQRNTNLNRGLAKCCIRRFIFRLAIFVILVIIASLYSSN